MIFNVLVHCNGIEKDVKGRAYGYQWKGTSSAQGASPDDAKMLLGLQEKVFFSI